VWRLSVVFRLRRDTEQGRAAPALRAVIPLSDDLLDLLFYTLALLAFGVVGSTRERWGGLWGIIRLVAATLVAVDLAVALLVLVGALSGVPATFLLLTPFAWVVTALRQILYSARPLS